MAHLTLADVSGDGRRLLLVSDAGEEHTLDIDHRLRAALRGETARLGQLEIKMDSALRPRDIQARIRHGETPEAVAQAAQTTVDRIMAFAGPVLAEREHVAQRAQRSSVRRKVGEAGGSARTLGEAVEAHLRSHNVDPDVVEWDAWRREDGRWTLLGSFAVTARTGAAEFVFDMPGNFVLLENDDARWLIGDAPATGAVRAPSARDDLQRARQRRLSAVPEDELPLGDDAIELVHAEHPVEAFLEDQPADPVLEDDVATAEHRRVEEAGDAAALDTDPPEVRAEAEPEPDQGPAKQADEQVDQEETPPRRPVRKTRGRASVPSWDEIMFGGGKQE